MPRILLFGERHLHGRATGVWTSALAIGLGLVFVAGSLPKLVGTGAEREMFREWGYPVWFMFAVGAFELLVGFLVLVPATRLWAALAIMAEMVGAAWTHAQAGQMPQMAIPIGVFAVATMLAWFERPERARQAGRPSPYTA